MTPVLAIIGRPNVGKSTLFNQLTQSRDALVADTPGSRAIGSSGTGRSANAVISASIPAVSGRRASGSRH